MFIENCQAGRRIRMARRPLLLKVFFSNSAFNCTKSYSCQHQPSLSSVRLRVAGGTSPPARMVCHFASSIAHHVMSSLKALLWILTWCDVRSQFAMPSLPLHDVRHSCHSLISLGEFYDSNLFEALWHYSSMSFWAVKLSCHSIVPIFNTGCHSMALFFLHKVCHSII